MTPEAIERYKIRHRFKPCKSKADLHNWIIAYLDLDMPDAIIDPESNSSPMDMIWEVYNAAIWENDKLSEAAQFMFYSARAAFKTLSAAILELLMIVHAKRNVVHMAAIEEQARKCQDYVKGFFARPYFRDFIVGDNLRTIEMVRYEKIGSKSEQNLTQKEWAKLTTADQAKYAIVDLKIEIAICTMTGSNSKHSTFMVVDEVDVVPNEKAYKQAKMIPDPADGKMPITVYISTRKTSIGLVQREIDEADETGLQIRHWNLIDVTEKCPPERHRPDLPKLPIYRNNADLKAISQEAYDKLIPAEKEKYDKDQGYTGCLENCRLFAVCRGRLADKQTSKSKLLKPVIATQGAFRKLAGDTDLAKAELMCWKPSSEGLIYPRLDPDIHVLTAGQIAEKITGEPYPENFTKEDLIKLFFMRKIRIDGGMDFGFTHNFSVVTAAIDGRRAFVFDVIEVAELELPQQIHHCKQRISAWNPQIWPDMASPQNIRAFHRAGFNMRKWKKGPDTVIGGIEIVRTKLRPPMSEPELYFLKDDGVSVLVKKLQKYHKKQDAAGRWMDEPDKVDDDCVDALRYLIMNVFAPKGKIVSGREVAESTIKPFVMPNTEEQQRSFNAQLWSKQIMQHVLGSDPDFMPSPQESMGPTPQGSVKKKGRFFFSV